MISITGGSGSGKTSLARLICEMLADRRVALITEDDYYHSLDHLGPNDPLPNFDHPESKDLDLLGEQMALARSAVGFQCPHYDFVTHRRTPGGKTVSPAEVVVLEGLHHMNSHAIRALIDLALYVDAPANIRLDRRIRRDIAERAIDEAESRRMFEEEVAPMHDLFVEPQKSHVHHVVVNVADEPSELRSWAEFSAKAVRQRLDGLHG